jgi:hypothetical protein
MRSKMYAEAQVGIVRSLAVIRGASSPRSVFGRG